MTAVERREILWIEMAESEGELKHHRQKREKLRRAAEVRLSDG